MAFLLFDNDTYTDRCKVGAEGPSNPGYQYIGPGVGAYTFDDPTQSFILGGPNPDYDLELGVVIRPKQHMAGESFPAMFETADLMFGSGMDFSISEVHLLSTSSLSLAKVSVIPAGYTSDDVDFPTETKVMSAYDMSDHTLNGGDKIRLAAIARMSMQNYRVNAPSTQAVRIRVESPEEFRVGDVFEVAAVSVNAPAHFNAERD